MKGAVQVEPAAVQLPAERHDTEVTLAFPPAFSDPTPGTSIAVRQVPVRATAPAVGAAVAASCAAHHTAAAPATTITTLRRRIGSQGKTPKEALRALKRQISDAFYLRRPRRQSQRRGPERARGERLCRQRGWLTPRTPA